MTLDYVDRFLPVIGEIAFHLKFSFKNLLQRDEVEVVVIYNENRISAIINLKVINKLFFSINTSI